MVNKTNHQPNIKLMSLTFKSKMKRIRVWMSIAWCWLSKWIHITNKHYRSRKEREKKKKKYSKTTTAKKWIKRKLGRTKANLPPSHSICTNKTTKRFQYNVCVVQLSVFWEMEIERKTHKLHTYMEILIFFFFQLTF